MSAVLAKRPPDAFFRFSADRFTQPFWDAAAEHRLVVARCSRCGHHRMPPTPFCPQCHRQQIEWITLPGTGAIYSYTVVSRAIMPGMDASLPYVPAVISLTHAPDCRLISNVVDAPLDAITVGAAVRVVWDDVNGVTVPRFTLALAQPFFRSNDDEFHID